MNSFLQMNSFLLHFICISLPRLYVKVWMRSGSGAYFFGNHKVKRYKMLCLETPSLKFSI